MIVRDPSFCTDEPLWSLFGTYDRKSYVLSLHTIPVKIHFTRQVIDTFIYNYSRAHL